MIRVDRHDEVRPGIWRYTVPGFGIEGRSRQPLLDACRQIRAIPAASAKVASVSLFGSGKWKRPRGRRRVRRGGGERKNLD
jgi:hypothetical protein